MSVNYGYQSNIMKKLPTVVNRCRENEDVYIGRGSIWGNPFVLHHESDRELVISQYRRYLWDCIKTGKLKRKDFENLEGKKLGCFCKPKKCHGDIIVNVCKNLDKVFPN